MGCALTEADSSGCRGLSLQPGLRLSAQTGIAVRSAPLRQGCDLIEPWGLGPQALKAHATLVRNEIRSGQRVEGFQKAGEHQPGRRR